MKSLGRRHEITVCDRPQNQIWELKVEHRQCNSHCLDSCIPAFIKENGSTPGYSNNYITWIKPFRLISDCSAPTTNFSLLSRGWKCLSDENKSLFSCSEAELLPLSLYIMLQPLHKERIGINLRQEAQTSAFPWEGWRAYLGSRSPKLIQLCQCAWFCPSAYLEMSDVKKIKFPALYRPTLKAVLT